MAALLLLRSLRFLALMMALTTTTTTMITVRARHHQGSPPTSYQSPPSTGYQGSDWMMGHATFYGDASAQSTIGGACGYTDRYGTNTAALSTVLFDSGFACGQCFQLQCTGSTGCCRSNPVVTITATNLCPPNPSQPNDNGGWCNPPLPHFDMALDAFSTIVCDTVVGIVPVMYRRVPCQRSGGMVFTTQGNAYWLLVFVSNVAGAGDISSMSAMGGGSGGTWISMSQNWGASWQLFAALGGQCVFFTVTSYSVQQTVYLHEVFPADWYVGGEYQSVENFQ